MKNLRKYASRDVLFKSLAETVASQISASLTAKGHATLAVPGGTTPAPFFEYLRKFDLGWENVKVLLTDERFVPETSERSNTRLLKQTLLQEKAAAATLIPLYQTGESPEAVLPFLIQRVAEVLPIDVCVLGMGADMHTASLFPGADQLEKALSDDAPALLPMRAPGAAEPRLTLTAPVLKSAQNIHILIVGTDKYTAFKKASEPGSNFDAPVRVILKQAQTHYAD